MTADLQKVWDQGRDLLDEAHPSLSRFAREHELSLTYHTPIPDQYGRGCPTVWQPLLELKLSRDAPWPRTELSVALRIGPHAGQPSSPGVLVGMFYVWAYVADTITSSRVVDFADDADPDHLLAAIHRALAEMSGPILANQKVDPYEADKKRRGTKYFWEYTYEAGIKTGRYWTDFDGSKYSCDFYPEDAEAMISDETGNVLYELVEDDEAPESIGDTFRFLEEKFAELMRDK